MVFIVAIVVIMADRLSKYLVALNLPEGASIPLAGELLRITHVRNPGAAFGILPNMQMVLIAASAAVIAAIAAYYAGHKPLRPAMKVALGLELGGAIGNLVDRLVYGRVTDFIDVRIWPVFNLADAAVVSGVAVLIFWFVAEEKKAGIKKTEVGD